jgi:plasmid stability protein
MQDRKTLLIRNLPETTVRRLHAVAALFGLKIGEYATRLLERGLQEDFERLHNQHRAEIEQKDRKAPGG